jgi:signal transduction histidine kinase
MTEVTGGGTRWRWSVTGLAVGVAEIAAVTGLILALKQVVPVSALTGLYILAILPIAVWWSFGLALMVAVASALTFDLVFTPPLFSLRITEPDTAANLVIFSLTAYVAAYVVSALARRAQRRAREAEALARDIRAAEEKTRRIADEQAALRRVATLVARAEPPAVLFAAVTEEAGRLLSADLTIMNRYDSDDEITVVGVWSPTGHLAATIGSKLSLGGRNATTVVFQTGRPARIDQYGEDAGAAPAPFIAAGMRSSVGAPITVHGRLWGVIIGASGREKPLPAGTEGRLAGFTELVATAIANAEAEAALTASRARVVAAADTTRRRIERNLHDGAQQRLVSLALELKAAQAVVPPVAGELAARLDHVAAEVSGVLDELREIARGIHPAALAEGGLRPALKALAGRAGVPVELDVRAEERLPEQIEVAAFYTVSEALTNAAKHSRAAFVHVRAEVFDGSLHVTVSDNGIGGADPGAGSGLFGLSDRADALGGTIVVTSPPGEGTTLALRLPIHRAAQADDAVA